MKLFFTQSYVPTFKFAGQKFAMLEEKILLSTLLRRYKIEVVQKPEDLIMVTELLTRPGRGVKVKISRRFYENSPNALNLENLPQVG